MTLQQHAGKCLIKLANAIDGSEKHAIITQALTEAVAEERELLAKEADARSTRYPEITDRWGEGYTVAMCEFAAAIRKVKP